MRILSSSFRRGTLFAATSIALFALAHNVGAGDGAKAVGETMAAAVPAPAEATAVAETVPVAASTATTANARDREADAAARRRAVLLLILQSSGLPFGFFK